ncbi:uncharacterized protein [Procambarus clarkii]|uniref:uncharacterized protein n=1 Tax=Procambarus clarkii TaxID=6728 RepID=UPI001E671405|nr:uncharacterized protein LOC123747143 [Procambarus clarkii]XP_045585128.1 uncharacterized protein LOC123747143 [Procambarus clarkii]
MYMTTKANLEYWSTDNFCVRWSLRTGACTIGTLSLVWQALMVVAGVMMLVDCPVDPAFTGTLDHQADTGTAQLALTGTAVHPTGTGVTSEASTGNSSLVSQPGDVPRASDNSSDQGVNSVDGEAVDSANSFFDVQGNTNSSNSALNVNFSCPWLPEPETQVFGINDRYKLETVAGIFMSYSSIYCILSLCVVLGVIKRSVVLLQGWVAFTGVHNVVILVFLLVPLPFTTLPHLICSIAHFIISLYTWAVVKSFMYSIKLENTQPLLPEGAVTDYTVDGVDVTEIPVEI